jgi:hypothetical protein
MSRTALRFLVATCTALVVWAESDIDINTKLPLSCPAHWNVTSAYMERLAYMWTHEHKVRNWIYKETADPSLANSTCALMEYDTVVKVPQRFADFIPSRVTETHVNKQVCGSRTELTERLRFSKIMLLGGFTITLHSSIDNERQLVVFACTCNIALPWFTQPLRQLIFGHVSKSILEYMQLLTDSLCK